MMAKVVDLKKTEMTCVVTGHIKVTGDDGNTRVVEPGTVLPEAMGWKYRDSLVNQGLLAVVPASDVEDAPVVETPSEEGDGSVSGATPPSTDSDDEEEGALLTQAEYDALEAEEVVSLHEDGYLTDDDVAEYERRRPGRPRNAIKALYETEDASDEA